MNVNAQKVYQFGVGISALCSALGLNAQEKGLCIDALIEGFVTTSDLDEEDRIKFSKIINKTIMEAKTMAQVEAIFASREVKKT